MSDKKELNLDEMENVAGGAKHKNKSKTNNDTSVNSQGNQINMKGLDNNQGVISNQQGSDGTQKTIQNIDTGDGSTINM